MNAESCELIAKGMKDLVAAFKDTRNNKVYLTGHTHDVDTLPMKLQKLFYKNEHEFFKYIIDGFWSKSKKKQWQHDIS